MKKKILSLFLCVAMLCAMLPMMAVSASAEAPEGWDYATADTTATADWYDAEATTLEINSAADLLAFAAKVQETARTTATTGPFYGKTVKLMKNIDLNPGWDASTKSADGVNIVWPVNAQRMFNGMFDGNGKTIRGIYITTDAMDVGIFGTAGGGTEAVPAGVKNLTVDNFYGVNTRSSGGEVRFGVLFGSANAEHMGDGYILVDNVHLGKNVYLAHATEKSGNAMAGFFGKIMYQSSNKMTVIIKNSSFDGVVEAPNSSQIGGIVGYYCGADVLTVQKTTFSGTVVGKLYVGGFVGVAAQFNASSPVRLTLEECVFDGKVDLSSTAGVAKPDTNLRKNYSGGFIGYTDNGSTTVIDKCASIGQVYSNQGHSDLGGVIGGVCGTSVFTMKNTLVTASVISGQNRLGIFAGTIDNCTSLTIDNCALLSSKVQGPSWAYTWQWIGALTGRCSVDGSKMTLKNIVYTDTYSAVPGAGMVLEDQTDLSTVYGENYPCFQHHLLAFGTYYTNNASTFLPENRTGSLTFPTLTNVEYVPFADKYDMDPAGALVAAMGEAGLTSANGWTLTTTNGPIPTAVLDKIDLVNTPANAKTQFKGFQGSQIADGKYNVRLIGLVDGLDPKEVGFRVIVRYNDGIEANVTTTSSVYTSVIGGARTYTVAELGGDADDYIFALNVNGIQESKGVITVEVTTFHVKDDVTTIGQTQVFTVDPANDLPKAGV